MAQKKTASYEDGLVERLKRPKYAAEYLNAHLADSKDGNEESFLLALRDVATAFGVAEISRETNLGRESLYKALSKTGNPKWSTLASILRAMGLQLTITATSKKAS